MPIAVEYGGSPALAPPAPEDEDNIVAALRRSDRIISIHLTVTLSLFVKLYSIMGLFSRLEDLVILSLDNVGLTFPSAFRWGPHLRTLHLTRITLPALSRLLSSSKDLVEIQLHEIPGIEYIFTESLWNALSGMTQLQLLSLRFDSLYSPTPTELLELYPPPRTRAVLPALTCFEYQGTSETFNSLVARVYAPYLEDIEITFFDEFTSDVTNLRRFIDEIQVRKSPLRADILLSESSVSISLIQPLPSCLKLQVICEPSSQKMLSISRFWSLFSTFFLCVEDLRIKAKRLSSSQDGLNLWMEVIRSFRATERFHLAGDFSTDFAHALKILLSQLGPESVLPALRKLYISQPGPRHAPLRLAVVSLMVSRRLSGHLIEVEYERPWINKLPEIGMTHAQRQYHTLTCLEQDLYLSRQQLRRYLTTSY